MPSPALLLCDTDVLIQLFLASELRPLKELKRVHGIQPAVVVEVADVELRWNGRYRARFAAETDKAIRTGILEKLDLNAFQKYLSAAPVGASWAEFQALGSKYYRLVQRGEAYTFAAAVTLGVPALSNDFRAIEFLKEHGELLPCPVLRGFDLIVFSYESGAIDLSACERFRDCLLEAREHIPKAFASTSFEKGLPRFRSRLVLSGSSSTGGAPPTSFDGVLELG